MGHAAPNWIKVASSVMACWNHRWHAFRGRALPPGVAFSRHSSPSPRAAGFHFGNATDQFFGAIPRHPIEGAGCGATIEKQRPSIARTEPSSTTGPFWDKSSAVHLLDRSAKQNSNGIMSVKNRFKAEFAAESGCEIASHKSCETYMACGAPSKKVLQVCGYFTSK